MFEEQRCRSTERAYLPPKCSGFDPGRVLYVISDWFWFSAFSKEFFSGYSGFSPSAKNHHPRFDQDTGPVCKPAEASFPSSLNLVINLLPICWIIDLFIISVLLFTYLLNCKLWSKQWAPKCGYYSNCHFCIINTNVITAVLSTWTTLYYFVLVYNCNLHFFLTCLRDV